MRIYLILLIAFVLNLSLQAKENLDSTLKKFESVAQKSMEDFKVPGMAIAIVKDGKVVFAKGFGVKEFGTNTPVDTHTIFQIGSVSKSFTSALIAQAVTEKKLKWDDRVMDHLPSFVLYDPWVTREFQVEDTLAQRSGLPSYAGDAQLFFGFTNDQIIHNIRYIAPITSFRTTFAYQNIFFNIASKILELKTNLSWDKMVENVFLQPLGMSESSATWDSLKNANNVIKPHELDDKGNPQVIKNENLLKGLYLYSPAGGINSNCLDMTKWLFFQLNNGMVNDKQLVSNENMLKTHTAHVYAGPWNGFESYYCLGWILSLYNPTPIIWHNGGTNGCSSMCAFIPNENLGIIILTNLTNTEMRHALALQFFDMYFDKPDFDWSKKLLVDSKKAQEAKKVNDPTNPLPPQPLNNYTGTFNNPIYGNAVVTTDKDNLKIALINGKYQMTLKPYNHDTFNIFWEYDEKGKEMKATFCFNADGKPQSLSISGLGMNEEMIFESIKKPK